SRTSRPTARSSWPTCISRTDRGRGAPSAGRRRRPPPASRQSGSFMLNYLGRRASHSVISILGLLILVFFLVRLTGDPSAHYLPLESTPEARDAFAKLNGLDQPIYIQFCHYPSDLARLDFGESMRQHRSALAV